MNLPRRWAYAKFKGQQRSVVNLRSCMTPEQLVAANRLLSDLRIKARRKPCT